MSQLSKIRTLCFDCIWLSVFFISLPWLVWRFVFKGKNRRGWKQKLFGMVAVSKKQSNAKRVWLHAVSVGEVHLLKTLVRQLLEANRDLEVVISTTTETGYDRAIALFGDRHQVCFFPFDFSWAIRNVFKRIDPDLLVLAELELWPNLIHLAAELDLPVVVVNGRLSKNSHRNYRRFGFLTRAMFENLHYVAAQDDISAERFVDSGCALQRVSVTGNLKYDAIETNRTNAKSDACRVIAREFGISDSDQILIAGSTQIEDEEVSVDAWLELRKTIDNLKLIIVPRHPDRIAEVEKLLSSRGLNANRRSHHRSSVSDSDILIVDVIGELSGWWALADVAFVGGSMGSRGGQNMIEPAAYGIPVCFGPNTSNFRSTVDGLLSADAAKMVRDADDLVRFASAMLNDEFKSSAIGARAQEFVLQSRGAVDQTVKLIAESLSVPVIAESALARRNRISA